MSVVQKFLSEITSKYNSGQATEHSYRPAFQALFQSLDNAITAVNEPKRVDCGAPDFIFIRKEIPLGHLEAKDLHVDIRNLKGANKKQLQRYRDALPNLIYTNGLDWDFYRDGKLLKSISIASLDDKITPNTEAFSTLEALLKDFVQQTPISITSPKDLAERMAGKAKLIKDVFHRVLSNDLKHNVDSEMVSQYETFRDNLIHDIKPESFADIYAETICYGMFAARLHDDTLDTFSRHEALDRLPKTNPFLRNLFSYVAGSGLDERVVWIIDDLADIFRATNVAAIMEGFGELTGRKDPFLHFYETFLAAYNPDKRKSRGVWYTPEPVVNFIVRAVDEVLQTEFGLEDGLADTSKIKIQWDTGQRKMTKAGTYTKDGKNAFEEKEVHRVQVLDPATGTGTFLAEVIKQIAPKIKNVAPGMWSSYIENDLMPRIHGFEILMASYAMCHIKLDMVLTELGYKPSTNPPRQSVYLTNSLEEGEPPQYALPFAQWLAKEVKLANTIKHDMPIMCVIGNPPYLGEGGVSEGWIGSLMDAYKKEPGGKVKLKERNSKWLNDLYVKFIRMSSHLIEKNGEGVLGFITNHSYLDNPTFRGMRWHLLDTFDKVWVLDLHGNAKKKEVDPIIGKPDQNVFDIQQGVSIIIAVKKKDGKNSLAEIMHGDLWGDRVNKYKVLSEYGLADGLFTSLETRPPRYPLVQRDWTAITAYKKGFPLNVFMPVNSVGVVTSRDSLVIDFNKKSLLSKIKKFINPHRSDNEIRSEFYPNKRSGKYLPGDNINWKLPDARKSLKTNKWEDDIRPIAYRPFDIRYILYRDDMVERSRNDVMSHMYMGKNLALMSCRQSAVDSWEHVFLTKEIVDDSFISNRTKERGYLFPLYLYPKDSETHNNDRKINFDIKLYIQLQKIATHSTHGKPDELAVFDYIYGVLHCPDYRETYAEFLKSDFPHIPWPKNPEEFWDISTKGTSLRQLHLMDPTTIINATYPFRGDGDNVVSTMNKDSFRDGKIWINQTQYFADVPKAAWEIYIGGYQPAWKWLKDRKGRALTFEEVRHYQCIIKVLSETDRIMNTITMKLDQD